MKIVINYISRFFQGKTKNCIEGCSKAISTTKDKEVWQEKTTTRFQEAKSEEQVCNEI